MQEIVAEHPERDKRCHQESISQYRKGNLVFSQQIKDQGNLLHGGRKNQIIRRTANLEGRMLLHRFLDKKALRRQYIFDLINKALVDLQNKLSPI